MNHHFSEKNNDFWNATTWPWQQIELERPESSATRRTVVRRLIGGKVKRVQGAAGQSPDPEASRYEPIVEMKVVVKASSENRNRMQVLPTPESPISSSLNSRSYVFLAMAPGAGGCGRGSGALGARAAPPSGAGAPRRRKAGLQLATVHLALGLRSHLTTAAARGTDLIAPRHGHVFFIFKLVNKRVELSTGVCSVGRIVGFHYFRDIGVRTELGFFSGAET